MIPEIQHIGKFIVIAGVLVVMIGLLLMFSDKLPDFLQKIPFLGRLPGDIYIKGEKFTFYFPIVTSIILSLIISLLIYLFKK